MSAKPKTLCYKTDGASQIPKLEQKQVKAVREKERKRDQKIEAEKLKAGVKKTMKEQKKKVPDPHLECKQWMHLHSKSGK